MEAKQLEPHEIRDQIAKFRQQRALKLFEWLEETPFNSLTVTACCEWKTDEDGTEYAEATGEYEASLKVGFMANSVQPQEGAVFKSSQKHKDPTSAIEECIKLFEGYRAKRHLDRFLLENPQASRALIEWLGDKAEEEPTV